MAARKTVSHKDAEEFIAMQKKESRKPKSVPTETAVAVLEAPVKATKEPKAPNQYERVKASYKVTTKAELVKAVKAEAKTEGNDMTTEEALTVIDLMFASELRLMQSE